MASSSSPHPGRLPVQRIIGMLSAAAIVIGISVQIASAAPPAPTALSHASVQGPAARAVAPDPTDALHDGVFRSRCLFSHTALDDPIVKPGQPGASHSHEFFANRTTNANSTYQSLLGKATTCRIGDDTAAYWVPSLLQNGVRVEPRFINAYYRSGGPIGGISAFPAGLKVVAGDSRATSPQPAPVTGWHCAGPNPGPVSPVPVVCDGGDSILAIRFPNCWNGVDLDSADHASHLVYGLRGRCPASHPVRVPLLALNVHYRLASVSGLALASGSIYSAHADFFNAWNQAALVALVNANLN